MNLINIWGHFEMPTFKSSFFQLSLHNLILCTIFFFFLWTPQTYNMIIFPSFAHSGLESPPKQSYIMEGVRIQNSCSYFLLILNVLLCYIHSLFTPFSWSLFIAFYSHKHLLMIISEHWKVHKHMLAHKNIWRMQDFLFYLVFIFVGLGTSWWELSQNTCFLFLMSNSLLIYF